MKFINRKQETAKLNELWEQKRAQLVVMYGKRRVGKTELIKQFIKDGRGIYFLADKRTLKDQLLEFARVVGNYFNDEFVAKKGFDDWLEAFQYLKQKAKNKQIVVALDEYPYLVETDSATSSLFQKIWDEIIKDTQIYLILCGSSIAMMESEVLSEKAPLYGRKTGLLLIESMNYQASLGFFPHTSFEKFMKFYSITGGMPAYMQQFSQYDSVEKAVKSLCWDKQGLYHHEVNLALKQELRTPNNYFAILKAIAWGKTQTGEIASYSGLEPQLVNKYMDTLIRLQFVQREVPVTEEKPHKSRKGIYILTENFVRFWFQYVYAFTSDLEISNYSQVNKRFQKYSNILEAITYENVARTHLKTLSSQLFPCDRVGRYWNSLVEIDGVGFNQAEKKIVFMEAKWSNSKQGNRTFNKLRQKAKSVPWNTNDRQEYYIIYSKSGFTKDLLKLNTQKKNLFLVHQDKIVI
ncbi:ATP-binding protein [Patescibacteria group bacterium]|nr:ATP-binding protein [Patescibacteria group bacterium]MBU1256211.1 ATP-binding protein [Patescibacteria group bacterium]MBU1457802.1 ATP-binding protein [Patescibacteria group bacterium]